MKSYWLLPLVMCVALFGCMPEPVGMTFSVASDDPATVEATRRVLLARLEEFPASMLSSVSSSSVGSAIQFVFKGGQPDPQTIEYLYRTRGRLRAVLATGGTTWFTDRDVVDAVGAYRDSKATLAMRLSPEAGARLSKLSSSKLGQVLVITMDGRQLVAATISGPLGAALEVPFPEAFADRHSELLAVLKSGALPAAVTAAAREK